MHGGCRSLRTSNSGPWSQEADRVKSIRLPALSTQYSALSTHLKDTEVRGEPVMSGSQPGPCTPMDRCSKKPRKTASFAIFQRPRRGDQVPRLDPQVVPCEADRACHGYCWTLWIPRGYRCTEP